jgi:hypothetical protein
VSIKTPFATLEAQIPTLITRLAPIAALGVAVQGLPNTRQDIGYKANDAVTLTWVAWSPFQGAGNAVSGLSTMGCTLNCRISTRSLSTRGEVADMLFQRLAGWELPTLPGHVLQFGGGELIPPLENEPDYRMDVRFAIVLQAKPPRG